MFHSLLQLPLTVPGVLIPVDVIAAALVLLVLLDLGRRGRKARQAGRGRTWLRLAIVVGAMVVGAGIGLLLVWWVGDVQDAFGVQFTIVTRMWVAFLFAAAAAFIAAIVQGGNGRRVTAFAAVAAVALAAGLGINVDFGAYKDLQQALVTNPYPKGTLGAEHAAAPGATVVQEADWQAPSTMPKRGKVIQIAIPAKVSHFHARHAVVYLPPAALTAHPPTLPVIVSLSGQPGAPADMFESGSMNRFLDQYAAQHHGLAPIVVDPDQLGAPNRNPMCIDSKRFGNSATYVLTDVTNWIKDHLNVGPAPDAWAITGFSQGATCSMQFSAEHPELYGSTLAISSELRQLNGSVEESAAIGYHGSVSAYLADSPIAQMRKHAPYLDHVTVFAVGGDDTPYLESTAQLKQAADHAGMKTDLIVSPGTAHDWNTVKYGLQHGLPEIMAHQGLPR